MSGNEREAYRNAVASFSPGLARVCEGLPWVFIKMSFNPQRGLRLFYQIAGTAFRVRDDF
ncbi:MAG: hypothetical protein PHD76_11090 [Methylacidiphilales bacterium]|nr:hypothetical protein [Candidatus Methylacidiphilales bacterium]